MRRTLRHRDARASAPESSFRPFQAIGRFILVIEMQCCERAVAYGRRCTDIGLSCIFANWRANPRTIRPVDSGAEPPASSGAHTKESPGRLCRARRTAVAVSLRAHRMHGWHPWRRGDSSRQRSRSAPCSAARESRAMGPCSGRRAIRLPRSVRPQPRRGHAPRPTIRTQSRTKCLRSRAWGQPSPKLRRVRSSSRRGRLSRPARP